MRILHLASFSGNIGDNASHMGFMTILNRFYPQMDVTRIEIRRFYKSYNEADKCAFDEDFVNYANSFDMFVIGGGGFLDYWVPNSATGTTIDISLDLVDKLNVNTLICSVGCMPHQNVPAGNVERFRSFLDVCLAKDNIKIALRNDGSVLSIKNEIGEQYLSHMPEILDNGFFHKTKSDFKFPCDDYVTLNITEDQIKMNSHAREVIEEDTYYAQLVNVVTSLVNGFKKNVVLVPHIYSDLRAINKLQSQLPDKLLRNNVFVAPCVQGDEGADYIFSIYKNSDLVLGTRLHANVCNLSMGHPIVGLVALDRVKYVYDYLDVSGQAHVLSGEFSENVLDCAARTLKNKEALAEKLIQNCDQAREKSLQIYASIFEGFKHG